MSNYQTDLCANTVDEENDRDDREGTTDDCSDTLGDTLQTAHPQIVVPTQCLDRRPAAMSQVEP